MSYHVERAAVEVRRTERTPEQIELEQIDRQRKRFKHLAWLMIGVSFLHLAAALLLFSGPGLFDQISTVGMILGLELFTAALAVYITESRRAGHHVGCMPWITFVTTLLISFGLNTSYLWSHRPDAAKVPDLLAKSIAIVFGAFIPLSIYTGATIGGSLDTLHSTIQRRYVEEELERQRKAAERDAKRTRIYDKSHTPLSAPRANNGVDTYSLDQLLQSAGLTRNNALSTLAQYGLDTPSKAYAALHSREKLPEGMDESTFTTLWSELHAAANPRIGNGKSKIGSQDVPAILAALHQQGITSFRLKKDLCTVCGWDSQTSAGNAVDALLAAGAIRQTAAGYEVISSNVG